MQLAAGAQAQGYRLKTFELLDSTNSEAMRRARERAESRLWIVANEQAAGRGRLARPWVSRPGNLYASLLLMGEVEAAQAAQLGFVTSVALAEALTQLLPSTKQPRLKWPNDILVNDAKIAGILVESTTLPDGQFICVIGCGVNCENHPSSTPYPATCMNALGAAASAGQLFERLSGCFADWYARWRRPGGFTPVRQAWLAAAAHIGEPIQVQQSGGTIESHFQTIDSHGRLVLSCRGRETIIDTGDVMFAAPAQHAVKKRSGD